MSDTTSNATPQPEVGFFDKLAAKIKKFSLDDDPAATFDESIPASGLLPSAASTFLSSTADTKRLVQEINVACHCAPAMETGKILDDTFEDLHEASKLAGVVLHFEKQNTDRAKQIKKDFVLPLCALIEKELTSVNKLLTLNLRVKLEKKKNVEEDSAAEGETEKKKSSQQSVHVEVFKQWTDHTETIARKFEEIEEERKKWDDIIANLENKK